MRTLSLLLFIAYAFPSQAQPPEKLITTYADLDTLNESQIPDKILEIDQLRQNDTIDIRVGKIPKQLDFSFCTFYQPFRMSVIFGGKVIVQGESKFMESADFSYSEFFDSLVFTNTAFYDELKLKHCKLPTAIRFDKVDLRGERKVDFSGSRLQDENAKCKLVLRETDVSNMVLPYNLFEFEFREPTNFEKQEQAYEVTIKNCLDAGMLESAQEWDIELSKLRNVRKYGFFGHIGNLINTIWWNFGYDKLWVWFWMLGFFAVFFTINYRFLDEMTDVYHDEEVIGSFLKESKTKARAIKKHRSMLALVFTSTIFFNFKLAISALDFRYPGRVSYIFLVYVIGTLHVVFGIGTSIFAALM